jgi:hypothetical protein
MHERVADAATVTAWVMVGVEVDIGNVEKKEKCRRQRTVKGGFFLIMKI